MKRVLSFLLCLTLLLPTLAGCGKAPELSEIEERLEWLLDESAMMNDMIFGSGLPTWPRVYDPLDTLQYYEDAQADKRYYYYTVEDGDREIIAYRTRSYGTDFKYLELVPDSEYAEGTEYVFHDDVAGVYYISLPDYVEKRADFYYNSSFPENYDVVVLGEAISIDRMKEMIETVYSRDYAASLYETLFVGAVISSEHDSGILTARFMEFTDDNGAVWLMESNTYEPLIDERRVYDVSTARILRGSNDEYVRLAIESYLESAPDERLEVNVAIVLQDGVWMLDSGTY